MKPWDERQRRVVQIAVTWGYQPIVILIAGARGRGFGCAFLIMIFHQLRPWKGVLWVGLLLWAGVVSAQERTPWQVPSEVPYDFEAGRVWRGKVPAPAEVLGYEVGESYADYGAFMRLLEAYRGSDRMMVQETGMTNERRPMHVLVISAPENLKRIDAIQKANRRLADGRNPLSESALNKQVAKQPIIVWLGYNIHGDEAAGTEAAMQVLHALLDDNSAEMRTWLRDVVVVMNPCQNPDGRERFVVWAKANGIGRSEPFAFEKENPWIVQGRTNHYRFDLNRDMIGMSQVESRNTGAAFLQWLPQVSVDHHGETKEYFFPPAMLPINPNGVRAQVDHWTTVFGEGNAAAFDGQHWMYYVRDYFDLFYPGYWDTWPMLQGATGMTYETSGGGKQGFNDRRDDGSIMTLRQAIAKHVVASFATIRTAAANREARLRDFHAYYVAAVAAGRAGETQQVFVPEVPAGSPLLSVLAAQGIEVNRLNASVTLSHATDGLGTVQEDVEVPVGAVVIDLAQPRGFAARAFLERHTPMDEAFVERQLEKVAKNRERGENVPTDDYEFYDQTVWSLPLMNGLRMWTTDAPADLSGKTVAVDAAVVSAGTSTVADPAGATAWIIPVDEAGARERVLGLLRQGYRVATAVRPLHVGERTFSRGSFIIRAERNPAEVVDALAPFSVEGSPGTVAVRSGFAAAGNTGIGSEATFSLKVPKVLLVADRPTSATSYGATQFLLDQVGTVDYVPVAAESLRRVDLREFNVIVMPSGWAGAWSRVLGDAGKAQLKSWVEQGGTLICFGGAAEFAADKDTDWTSATIVGTEAGEGSESEDVAFDDRPLPLPGALLRAQVAPEHFLAFGYPTESIPYFAAGDVFFQASDTGSNVVTFADEQLWVAGHIWPDNTERLVGGTAAVIDEPVGDGHIILFNDEPGFRAIWNGSVPMFLNALLYAPGLKNDVGSYVR